MTRVYRFALVTVLSTLALIAIGSLARLHPAGSGCGNDWPLCNGSWLPALAWEPLVEYVHRLIAVAVILFASGTALTAFRTSGTSRQVRLFAASSLIVILIQSAVGGFAARWGAPAVIAVAHLASAMLFLAFATITLAGIAAQRGTPGWLADLGRAPARTADRPFAIVAALGAVTALMLLIFGASTSATGAFACASWPLCADGVGGNDGPLIVHLGYRTTALLGTLAAGSFGSICLAPRRVRYGPLPHRSRRAARCPPERDERCRMVADDPVWLSSPHLVVATLFWISMLGVALAAWGPRPAVASIEPSAESRLALWRRDR